MPDGGGEGEDALQDACGDSGDGSSSVALEVELGFEGVVERFDDLPQRLEEALSGTGFFSPAGRAQQLDTGVGERGFELSAVVVLVGHQRLTGTRREQVGVGVEHAEQNFAFVGLGAGQRERHRQPG